MENTLPDAAGPSAPLKPAPAATSALVDRARAAGLHLLISVGVTAAVFAVMIALWYPWPIFVAAGAPQLLLLVSACDVILGPALTFVVYRKGKRSLVFDLAVIAALQIGALAYGVHAVHLARPVFMVFAVDRFELVSDADIDAEQLALAPERFRVLSQTGPRVVGAQLPEDPQERSRLLLAAATKGIDLRLLPRYYTDYDTVRRQGLAKAQAVARLRQFNPADEVDAALKSVDRAEDAVRWYPVRGGKRDLVAFVDAASGELLRLVRLQPWAP
jgi:hypothetical protein